MRNPDRPMARPWQSLSLRLSAAFVAVLVTAAFAVGYVFDRGRSEAVEKRTMAQLGLRAERGANEVSQFIGQLRLDVLFLSRTPASLAVGRALEAAGADGTADSTPGRWRERLEQVFLAFGDSRPAYVELSFIAARDPAEEVVRVEGTPGGPRAIPPAELRHKTDGCCGREASRLPGGPIALFWVEPAQGAGSRLAAEAPTLCAAAQVRGSDGNLVGTVVVGMDLGWAMAQARSLDRETGAVYLADQAGNLLLHADPAAEPATGLDRPTRLADAFPGQAESIAATLASGGGFLELTGRTGKLAAFVTTRAWDAEDPSLRLTYLVTESMEGVMRESGLLRRNSLLGMGALLALAIVLMVAVTRRTTRSLSMLANAADTIADGHWPNLPPAADAGEVGRLAAAFRSMTDRVRHREQALADLTQDLEQRVAERTAQLAQQHAVQQLILENIADGVIVADRDGHFLLWNRRAEQMVGVGPKDVSPEDWSSHFGVLRDEGGEPVPADELPLLRALRGEPTDATELFLRPPGCASGRWAQVSARPLLSPEGEQSGAVAVLVDVTETKDLRRSAEMHRAELAKEQEVAFRAEIASSVAHQLSQPIAAMSNYAGAAVRLQEQGRLSDHTLRDLLGRVEALSIQAGRILDRLRTLVRRPRRPAMPMDVNQVAGFCLDFLAERIQGQGIRVERCFGQDLPRPIGERAQLSHALIQLMSHLLETLESGPAGERYLRVATSHDPHASLVLIDLTNGGLDGDPRLTDILHEPWQGDEDAHELDIGGIGLSIAQTMVETHKGRIRMASGAVGVACFRIELPVPSEGAA